MTDPRSPYSGEFIVDWVDQGLKLRDVNDEEVGDILEVNPDFIIVETSGGFLGLGEKRTYYVPRSEVTSRDDDTWYLAITRDRLESMAWSSPPAASTWTTTAPEVLAEARRGGTRLVRYEEDLDVTKVARQTGEVRVTKEVVEETKTIEVPLRHEEVHVERRPLSGEATVGDLSDETLREETIRVPVMEEDVEVRKVVRPVEEVEVTTTPVEETRHVEETVRREEFDIDDTSGRVRRDVDRGEPRR